MRALRAATLALVALLAARAALAEKADVYALVGAKIVTVSGPVHESATVVLRDGLVEAVGPDVATPRDARVIDAKGLVLTPGLIDAFSGAGLPAAPARGGGGGAGGGGGGSASAPAAGSLSPQALVIERVRPSEVLKVRDSGITTVLVVPREGVLPGRSVLLNLSGEKAESMALKQPAALHLHLATLARGQYPGSLMGTVALARQALLDGQRYREEWAAYEKAPAGKKRPKYDSALEAWAEVASGRLPLWVTATRENDVRRTLGLADEFKVKVGLLGAPQAYRAAALIKARKVPLVVSVNFDPPRAAGFFGGGDEERERKDIEEAERNPAELHKAGVSFALGSGHAKDFLAGVRKAIEKGLPREAALRAVTLGAAEALGVADRTGSLERGKVANLVAWSGDPLTKDAKVKMLFVDGQLYEPEERPERKDDEKKPEAKPTEGGSGEVLP